MRPSVQPLMNEKPTRQRYAGAWGRPGVAPGLGGSWSRCYFFGLDRAIGGAQVAPINVGPNVLAPDGAICDALNGRASISRKRTCARGPLIDCLFGYTKVLCQRLLATHHFASVFYRIHGAIVKQYFPACQALLQIKLNADN